MSDDVLKMESDARASIVSMHKSGAGTERTDIEIKKLMHKWLYWLFNTKSRRFNALSGIIFCE